MKLSLSPMYLFYVFVLTLPCRVGLKLAEEITWGVVFLGSMIGLSKSISLAPGFGSVWAVFLFCLEKELGDGVAVEAAKPTSIWAARMGALVRGGLHPGQLEDGGHHSHWDGHKGRV